MNEIEINRIELTALLEMIETVTIKGDKITITSKGLAVTLSFGNIKGVKMNTSLLCEGDFEIETNLHFSIYYSNDDGFDIDLS